MVKQASSRELSKLSDTDGETAFLEVRVHRSEGQHGELPSVDVQDAAALDRSVEPCDDVDIAPVPCWTLVATTPALVTVSTSKAIVPCPLLASDSQARVGSRSA